MGLTAEDRAGFLLDIERLYEEIEEALSEEPMNPARIMRATASSVALSMVGVAALLEDENK